MLWGWSSSRSPNPFTPKKEMNNNDKKVFPPHASEGVKEQDNKTFLVLLGYTQKERMVLGCGIVRENHTL
jgi:hypothetical protein